MAALERPDDNLPLTKTNKANALIEIYKGSLGSPNETQVKLGTPEIPEFFAIEEHVKELRKPSKYKSVYPDGMHPAIAQPID